MKKLIIIIISLFILVGCTKISDLTYDDIINRVLASNVDLSNQYRTGYKYYLPRGLKVEDSKEYNEKITSESTKYYLYIDIVSYYNKVAENYNINNEALYSQKIINNDKYGYVEIKKYNEEDNYLIEIMYNYAKIEVIVSHSAIKTTLFNAITILSSIEYNEDIINNFMGENILEFSEVEINIFETKKTDSNELKYYEEYGTYEDDNLIPDTDVIR